MLTYPASPTIGMFRVNNVKDILDDFRRTTSQGLVAVIQTSYVQATDDKGACYRAVDLHTGDIHFVAPDYSLTTGENHLHAAIDLISEFRVSDYRLISISTDGFSGKGYVITFTTVEAV